jgi:hypothetical protein
MYYNTFLHRCIVIFMLRLRTSESVQILLIPFRGCPRSTRALCDTLGPNSKFPPVQSGLLNRTAPTPAHAPSSSSSKNDFTAFSNPNSSSAPVDVVEDRDAISADEAQSFISNVILRCINLLDMNNGRELMTHALGCVDVTNQPQRDST